MFFVAHTLTHARKNYSKVHICMYTYIYMYTAAAVAAAAEACTAAGTIAG